MPEIVHVARDDLPSRLPRLHDEELLEFPFEFVCIRCLETALLVVEVERHNSGDLLSLTRSQGGLNAHFRLPFSKKQPTHNMLASCILAYLAKVSQGVEGVGMTPQWNRTFGGTGGLRHAFRPSIYKTTIYEKRDKSLSTLIYRTFKGFSCSLLISICRLQLPVPPIELHRQV